LSYNLNESGVYDATVLFERWPGGSVEYFRGPRHALLWLYRHYGIPGVYRGFTIFAIRDTPAFGTYIVVYEFLYDYLYTVRSVHVSWIT